jgi:hypothetical protein
MNRLNKIPFAIMFLLLLPAINAISLSINSPAYIIEGQSVNVNFSINSNSAFNGTVQLSYTNINSSITSVNFTNTSFTGSYYNHTWSITGNAPGIYSIYGKLVNSSGITLDTLNKTGTVNSSIPKVISTSPSGTVSKDSVTLLITTNEAATCKYDTTNNSYEGLSNTFSNTDGIYHNQSLNSLSEGQHTYYVKCQDAQGYTMNESAIIQFTIDLPPTAQIILSDSSPVKAGTIEVTLITSENLENIPTLEYSFNDAPTTKKQISLTGSGSSWKGYLIITETDDEKIGTFYFAATDSSGTAGTKITSGNIFLVDTTKPPVPASVKAESQADGSIKIKWYYDGEEVDHFNIYRATSSGINYVDFYAEGENISGQYTDKSTIDKVTYYYKISAVDKAGNEGSLSEEIFATSVSKIPRNTTTSTTEEAIGDTPKVLPPDLVPRVDTFIKKIDMLLIDVKVISNDLENAEQEKKNLIREFKISEGIENAKAKLEELRQKLEDFKLTYATESELEEKLKQVDLEAKKLEQTTPKDIEVVEKTEFLQITTEEDIKIAVSELLKDMGLTEDEKSNYVKLNNRKKDKIKIDLNAKVIRLENLDGSKEEKTFINKKLSYQEPEQLEDVIIVEIIPKSVAESVNEITFLNQKYEILKEDPIVKFGFLKFDYEGESISYSLNKIIDLEEIKNIKSVVLLSLSELTKESSKVTGFSIFSFSNLGLSKTQSFFVWLGIILILALGAYYLLFIKNYKNLFKKFYRKLNIKKLKSSVMDKEYTPAVYTNEDNSESIRAIQPKHSNLQVSEENASAILNDMFFHINDAKIELADKLLPLFVTLNDKLESKGFKRKKIMTQNNVVFINTLIEQAHNHLDNCSYSEAIKLYPRICFIYQNLPKELKSEVYRRCVDLQNRINLKSLNAKL